MVDPQHATGVTGRAGVCEASPWPGPWRRLSTRPAGAIRPLARLRQVVAFAAEFYRQLMHAQSDVSLAADIEIQTRCPGHRAGLADPGSAARLDRCLDAAGQIDRNANQATLIECWLDDLGEASTSSMNSFMGIGADGQGRDSKGLTPPSFPPAGRPDHRQEPALNA